PDTCSSGSSRNTGTLLPLPGATKPLGFPDPCVWPVKGTSRHPAVQSAKAAIETAELEERNRLLYVAMTRARDRLYVAGFETKSGRGQGCWYDLIHETLQGVCEQVETADGHTILRYACAQSAPPDEPGDEVSGQTIPAPLPDWAKRKAPREPATTFPLAPSRLAPLETDAAGDPVAVEPGTQA